MVNIVDVATKAKVSVSTVSFVLNGRAEEMRISEKTIKKVLAISQELGYIPNLAAKKLSSSGGSTLPEVALFWTMAQNSTFMNIFITEAQALSDEGKARSMRFVVEPFRMGQLNRQEDILKRGQYNGIVIPLVSDEDVAYINSLDLHIPVIILHGETSKYSTIAVDNYLGGRRAAEVFAARGCKSVAIINHKYFSEDLNVRNRCRGFLDACREYGMKAETIEAQEKKYSGTDYFDSNAGLGSVTAEELLSRSELPEAVFIQNDILAAWFMNNMTGAGVRVPEDMAIITYGSDFLPETCRPTMTSIHFPTVELSQETILLMSDFLINPMMMPKRKLVSPPVIFRESCPKPDGFKE